MRIREVRGDSQADSGTPESPAESGGQPPRGGTWLVLGGGGLKGLAHVGAWEALREAGIEVHGIVGTSIGALVGSLAASGMAVEEMRALALAIDRSRVAKVNRRAVWINGIRQPSLFQGETLRSLYAEILPRGGWGALRIPVLMNAVDLADGSSVWFGAGARTDLSLMEAVYASSALPVFYPPQQVPGHAYVDGGIADALPIAKAADLSAARIIAVDVGSGGEADVREVVRNGMIAVHQRVAAIMMAAQRHATVSEWTDPRLTYVRPRLAGYGTFDFEHIPYFLDEGRRATREAVGKS